MTDQDIIRTDKAPPPVGAYPHARRHGDLLYLSGIGPRGTGGEDIPGVVLDDAGKLVSYDIASQCHSVFANVKSVLEAAGSGWDQLIDVTVFLTDIEKDFDIYNKIYAEYFRDNQPCRTTVEVNRLPTPIAIELKCVATLNPGRQSKSSTMNGLKMPFNLQAWIDENRHLLKPPVCNQQVYQDSEFIVMIVGGPNSRKDYHYDEGEEFFYQLEGDMLLKTMQNGKPVDIPIRAGEIFLLPPRIPHSPQRFADTVGLVIERQRRPGEQDGFIWYCENCHEKLYEEYFGLTDIVSQLPPVFERFFSNPEHRRCKNCGEVMEPPGGGN
ncbi:MAG: 3-hydroxyanthranilate 3,4-dioxygenase [Gammaproteobacteria bacterium]|nr:3-hydroxyanthranilate 3,4-dioxygenase [Gammaproteobacteria bacterium]